MTLDHAYRSRQRVSLVALPQVFGNRMVHLSTQGPYTWAIRDYIGGWLLRSRRSRLTTAQLEALVTHCEPPVACPIYLKRTWKEELEARSQRHFRDSYDPTSLPLTSAGAWARL
jgi:hypothetical protein